ncbi:uncharacterized protein LOC114176147, partial [Vigna unguiculata]|uniref:uncharacterized protein LOC114176147 n=1 Tax=Vigna unguiculata TaxID=3917 RepID=UPI0010161B72
RSRCSDGRSNEHEPLGHSIGIQTHNRRPLPPLPGPLGHLPPPSLLLHHRLPLPLPSLIPSPIPKHTPPTLFPNPNPNPLLPPPHPLPPLPPPLLPLRPRLHHPQRLPRLLRPPRQTPLRPPLHPPSLPRLILTTFLSHFLLFSLSLPLPFLLLRLSLASPLILTASTLLLLALLLALLYLRVSWSLAPVIVVAESTWGLQPLRRSASLVSGMTPVAASSFLFFASLQALLLWTAFLLRSDGWAWKDWAFITQIVLTSTLLMILMLYRAAADTVLYMYCKAVHGELAVDIAQEFAWQYVCLPFDDGKVPHVVSVVHV